MKQSIQKLEDYLRSKGWDIISESFFLNDKANCHVVYEDERVHYFENGEEKEEVPLDIMVHQLFQRIDEEKYNKIIRIFDLLNKRGYHLYYKGCNFVIPGYECDFLDGYDNYHIWAHNNSFWGFECRLPDYVTISCTANEGITLFDRKIHDEYFSSCGRVNDKLIERLMIELALLLNSDFIYLEKKGIFSYPDEVIQNIIKHHTK